MTQSPTLKVDLRRLILVLTIVSVFITMSNSFYSIYTFQRELLINKTMESNQVYAQKMAEVTDTFIESAQEQLAYSALLLQDVMDDDSRLMSEAERIRLQTKTFNSVVVVNAKGTIVAASPEALQIKGLRLSSENSLQSLREKRPFVTDPFVSPVGNYLISISHPIFSKQGEYLGYIGGTIYLEKKNILSDVLGQHSYHDGSYLYVVDHNKTLIYHPNKDRIGQVIHNNDAINYVLTEHAGSMNVINSLGIDMLAGFSPVKATGWGIVVQRPKNKTLAELDNQMLEVFISSIPIALLTLLGIWVSAIFISRPLWQLAQEVKTLDQDAPVEHIHNIRSWYFEAAQLKTAIVKCLDMMRSRITQLDTDRHTDPMTGLLNRRGMLKALDALSEGQQGFYVMAIDIDHFKQVNDVYGHATGDIAIKAVAELMQRYAHKKGMLCRSGGEEFLAFLTNTNLRDTWAVAEEIREAISLEEIPPIGKVTVSIGIAYCSGDSNVVETAIKEADTALYKAKIEGRNRTVCSDENAQTSLDFSG